MTDSTLTPPQEAREAAAACARVIYGERIAVKISAGEMDRHHLVQAFARFEQSIRRDEAEKCLESVRGERLADPQEGTDDASYERALDHAEAAIRARHAEGEG